MYSKHNPTIAAYMRESVEGFTRGVWFAVLSIRQPIVKVPDQLQRLSAGDSSPLFGHKRDAIAYLDQHAARLHAAILAAPDNAARIAVLLDVPGLGIVKAGFVLQLMGYDVACLDSRNVTREGRNPEAFKSRGAKGKLQPGFRAKVRAYLAEVEGRSQAYWDDWCADVANVYGKTANEISELHLAIVPDAYVPF